MHGQIKYNLAGMDSALAVATERLGVLAGQLLCQQPPGVHAAPASASQAATAHPGRHSNIPVLVYKGSAAPIVIVGGAVLDIQSRPSNVDIQRGTSVPGEVRQVPGGVGRNIAEAISKLALPSQPAPMFIGMVGDDTAGTYLTNALRTLRLDLTCLLTVKGVATPCVSAVFDKSAEVAACVADVTSVEQHLTPERIKECQSQIQRAGLLVTEANLAEPSLAAVCAMAGAAGVPVFLEPVSVPKSKRLAGVLQYATFVSPNAGELMAMADEVRTRQGAPLLPRPSLDMIEGDAPGPNDPPGKASLVLALLQQLATFAAVLLREGNKCVVLTLGSLGAALLTREGFLPPPPDQQVHQVLGGPAGPGAEAVEVAYLRALPADVVSVSGAGDTLVAGMVAALTQGWPVVESLAYGMAAAKRAVESFSNVPKGLEMSKLSGDASAVLSTAQRYTIVLA